MDWLIRDHGGLGFDKRLPAVMGFDVVGTIQAYGPDTAKTLPIGTQVYSQVDPSDPIGGSLQEYTVVLERFAIPLPKNVTAVEASTFPINALTAGVALFSHDGLNIPFPGTEGSEGFDYANQMVVVRGGGTNTGKFAIQMLRNAGIGKIIVTASLSRTEELKGYGATHVIDRKAPDVKDQIRAIVGDDLIYVYDSFLATDYNLQVSILSNSKKGTVARICPGEVKVDAAVENEKKAGWAHTLTYGSPSMYPEFADVFLQTFRKWAEEGKIVASQVKVVEGLDVDKINEVLDEMSAWTGSGKLTVKV